MAEQNVTKLVKRLKGLPPAKATAELIKLNDEYIFFDLVEEFGGLTGIEASILAAAEKMNAEEFLEAYRTRLKCAVVLQEIKGKNKQVREDRIVSEYEKSDDKEFFLYELAELDDFEETGILGSIIAAARRAGNQEFLDEYES